LIGCARNCRPAQGEKEEDMTRRRWFTLVAALGVGVSGIAGGAVAFGFGGADITQPTTLVLYQTSHDILVNTGPGGAPKPGTLDLQYGSLFHDQAKTQPAGRIEGDCLVITVNPFRVECEGTLITPTGDLLFRGPAPTNQAGTVTDAVIGGTGHYRNADGTVFAAVISPNPQLFKLTFHLLP
jgi:hypothetical protein